jgi:hypothetical protein
MLVMAWGYTALRYLSGRTGWRERARTFERVGVAVLPVTLVAGFIDTRGIEFLRDRRWDQPLIWHMIIASATTVIFVVHFVWSRRLGAEVTMRTAAVDLSLMTLGLWGLLLSGAIAAEMVYGV